MVNGYSINSINNKSPLWKQLGYSSEAEWRQATGGGSLAGYTNPTLKPTTPSLPTGPSVQMPNLSNYFNGSVVGVGGSIGKGNGNGGVTDEGVIIGNPSVNNSTFNKTSYGGSSSEKEEESTSTPTQTKPTVDLEASASGSKPVESESTESGGSATGTGSYSYNNEARFLEWYKRNYGVDYDPAVGLQRPEGMDDGVWAAGNTLYSYYLEEQRDEKQREELLGTRNEYYDEQAENLLANYATAQEALDKSKRNSQQTSSITYDKLKKYLPTQIKAQGLGGLGVSETTMLQAQTNYANEMGEIERAYSEDSANLASNKADDMTNLEKYRQDALDRVNETYDSIARTREDNARLGASADMSAYKTAVETTQKNNYDNALNSIDYSGIYDQAEMNAFIEKFRGTVSDEQFASLVSRGESVVSANSKGRTDTEQKGVYDTALAAIEKLDYTSQSDMDTYIEGFRGKVSESQFNELVIAGQAKVTANNTALNDSKYNTEVGVLQAKYEQMISDTDGKISQADYDTLVAYADEIGNKLGSNYRSALDSVLNEYKLAVRSEADQLAVDYGASVRTDITMKGNLNAANDDYGDNFKINYGGSSYKVEKGYDASDTVNARLTEIFVNSQGANPANGAVMIYNGHIYMYLENNDKSGNPSVWCMIQGRKNNDEGLRNLCSALGISSYGRGITDAD